MRYYPEGDPDFYFEDANPCNALREPTLSWHLRKNPPSSTILYYRDIEGTSLQKITAKHLKFPDAQRNNRREGAVFNDSVGKKPLPMSLAQILERERLEEECAQKKRELKKIGEGKKKSAKGR